MKIDLIIVDWSGVVSDDRKYVCDIVNKVMEAYSKQPISLEQFSKSIILDFEKFWNKFRVYDDLEEIQRRFNSFLDKVETRPKLIKDAYHTLNLLADKRKKLAVISAHPNVKNEMYYYAITHLFNDVRAPIKKSNIEDYCSTIDELMSRNKTKKNRTILVEDMVGGVKAGKKAGVITVALCDPRYGYHTKEKLIEQNPDYLIENIKELEKIIE